MYVPPLDFQEGDKYGALMDHFAAPYLSVRIYLFSNLIGDFFQLYVPIVSFEKVKTHIKYKRIPVYTLCHICTLFFSL